MVATYETLPTDGLSWYSTGLGNPGFEVTSWIHERLVAWLGEICNPTLDSGTLVGGSGYTDGTYTDVSLVRVSNRVNGKDLLCTVTVSSGAVTSVVITQKGNGFKDGDLLEFEDISQVGGTGAGFNINIDTADASICINRDPDDSTGSYWGWLLGVERGLTNCVYGKYFLWRSASSTSTTYDYHFYSWTDTTANYGMGDRNATSQTSYAFIYPGAYGGRSIHLAYEANPDQRYFMVSDTLYNTVHGVFQAVQNPQATYLPTSVASPWCSFMSSGYIYTRPINNAGWNTDFVGSGDYRSHSLPSHENCLFRGPAVWGRGTGWGSIPTNIGLHTNATRTPGATLSNGTETWVHLGNCATFKIAN